MSHPTIEELHDIAYGFRPEEEHMLDCADCAQTVRLIAKERAFFRRALVEAPRASRWGRAVPLAAAAALAIGMLWAVFRPAPAESPIRAPAQERPQEMFDVDRFVRELKSSNALRRAAARQALRAYGGAAVEAVRAAGENELLEEILEPTEADRALLHKLETIRFQAINFSESNLSDVVDFLRDFTGINIVVEQGLEDRRVTIALKDAIADEALQKILDPLKLRFEATQGFLLITAKPKPPPEGFVPLRFPVGDALRRETAARIAELADPAIEKRAAAAARLEGLGFAAEAALWAGLEAAQPDVQTACAGLLEQLYRRRTESQPLADPSADSLREKLRTARVTLQMKEVSLREFAESISDSAGVSMMVDPRVVCDSRPVSIQVADIAVNGALKLALAVDRMDYVCIGNVVFVTKFDLMPIRSRWEPRNTLWISAEDAAILGPLFEKSDLEGLRKLGWKTVRFLRFAQSHVDTGLAAKYEAVARAILDESPGWFADEPAGLRRQGGKALDTLDSLRLDCAFADAPPAMVLGFLRDFTGVRFEPAAPLPSGPWTLKLKGVRTTDLLDLLTRPYGLDYAEQDGKIVIDTKAAIRKLVGK